MTWSDFLFYLFHSLSWYYDYQPGNYEFFKQSLLSLSRDNRNILLDDTGHLKVADFDVSKLLKVAKTAREDRPLTCLDACKSRIINFCIYLFDKLYSVLVTWRYAFFIVLNDVFAFLLHVWALSNLVLFHSLEFCLIKHISSYIRTMDINIRDAHDMTQICWLGKSYKKKHKMCTWQLKHIHCSKYLDDFFKKIILI